MTTVSVTQAKAAWLDLIERVEAGERVIITRWGRPVAELQPFAGPAETRNKPVI